MFIEQDTTQILLEHKLIEEGLIRFAFRRPAQNVSITTTPVLPDTFAWVEVPSKDYDTICWYFTPNVLDSLRVYINYDTLINDSTRYNLKFKEIPQRGRPTKKILQVSNNLQNGLLMPGEDLVLKFSEPVTSIVMHDTSIFRSDTTEQINMMQFEKIDSVGMEYRLTEILLDDMRHSLVVADSVFWGIRNRTNEKLSLEFRRAKENDLGNIILTVVPPDGVHTIVEVLDAKGHIIERQFIDEEKKIRFEHLIPGKYKVRAILDTDGNGRWSTGNFHKRFLPERILDYKEELEVRAGWDFELDWTL